MIAAVVAIPAIAGVVVARRRDEGHRLAPFFAAFAIAFVIQVAVAAVVVGLICASIAGGQA